MPRPNLGKWVLKQIFCQKPIILLCHSVKTHCCVVQLCLFLYQQQAGEALHFPVVHLAVSTYFAMMQYCKTCYFRVPFILRISRAWQVRENNGLRKFEYSSVSV